MEDLAADLGEALFTECQACLDELDVGALVQRVLHDLLVLLDCDGTCGVDNVATGLAVVVDRVDGRQEQLFLQVGKLHEIGLGLVGLDAGVLCDDTRTRAGRVEQNAVKATHDLGELEGRVVAHNGVSDTQTVDVTDQTLGTLFACVVGEDAARVLHQRSQMRRLTTGSSGHVEHALVLLGRQGHDGQERRRSLQDVVAGQVLGRGTERDVGVEDLQTDLGPLADGLELDATVDERLGELTAMCAEGVCADDDGTGRLVGLEEGKGLAGREQAEELVCEELGVAVVRADVLEQLRAVLGPVAARLSEVLEVVEHADRVVEPCAQQLDVLCDEVGDLAALFVLVVVQHLWPVARCNVGLHVALLELGLGLGLFNRPLHVELARQTFDVGRRELLLRILVVLVVGPHGLLARLHVRVEVVVVHVAVLFRGAAERIEARDLDGAVCVFHVVVVGKVGEVVVVAVVVVGRWRRRSLLRRLSTVRGRCGALLRSAIRGSGLLQHGRSLGLCLCVCPPPLLLLGCGRLVVLPLARDERLVEGAGHALLLLSSHATHVCGCLCGEGGELVEGIVFLRRLHRETFGQLSFRISRTGRRLFFSVQVAPAAWPRRAETMSFADQAVRQTHDDIAQGTLEIVWPPSTRTHRRDLLPDPARHTATRNHVRARLLQDVPGRNRLAPRQALLRLRLRRAHLPSNRRCTLSFSLNPPHTARHPS